MSTKIGRERSLEKALKAVPDDYDFVCIDTPPSLGLLTINALTAASKVIVPVQCEYLSMRGLIQLQNTLAMIREELNPDVQIEGILPTLVDTRTVHAKEAIEILEENFGDRVFATRIKKTIRFAEAPVKGTSVLKYDPDGVRPRVLPRTCEGGPGEWQAVSEQACGKGRWPPCSAGPTRTPRGAAEPPDTRSRARRARPRAGPAAQERRAEPEPRALREAGRAHRAPPPCRARRTGSAPRSRRTSRTTSLSARRPPSATGAPATSRSIAARDRPCGPSHGRRHRRRRRQRRQPHDRGRRRGRRVHRRQHRPAVAPAERRRRDAPHRLGHHARAGLRLGPERRPRFRDLRR